MPSATERRRRHRRNTWHPVQTVAPGWWSRLSAWQLPVQVARSSRGGSCGDAWQLAQTAWPGAAWSAGKRGRRVAGRARGWSRDAAGAVRTMAGRAAAGIVACGSLALVRVARGARGRGLPGVRLVAADAALVAGGRGPLLGGVAGPAGRRRRDRVHDRGAVARRAVGVTRVRGHERGLARVAARGRASSRRAPRRRAACGTPRTRCLPRARPCRRRPPSRGSSCRWTATATGSSPWGAWQVTHAPALPWLTWTFWWHPHARGGGLARGVRLVAVEAHAVSRDLAVDQRGLRAVAADARAVARDEVVRLVAADARVVGRRVRLRRLARGTTRTSVVATAAGSWARWQSRQPFEPACSACFVARSSWQPVQSAGTIGRGLVQVVARRAVDRRVLHDGRQSCPAASRGSRCTSARCCPSANAWHVRQSVELRRARGGGRPPVSLAWHFAQTAVPGFLNPSRSKSWQSWHSAFPPPTCVWCPGVVRYCAHDAGTRSGGTPFGPCGQSLTSAATHAATTHDRGGEAPDDASRDPRHRPTPWQRRHGRSWCSSLWLVKPGPCGLPPGPPTLWQPTQSCSPAPPWQPAHDDGIDARLHAVLAVRPARRVRASRRRARRRSGACGSRRRSSRCGRSCRDPGRRAPRRRDAPRSRRDGARTGSRRRGRASRAARGRCPRRGTTRTAARCGSSRRGRARSPRARRARGRSRRRGRGGRRAARPRRADRRGSRRSRAASTGRGARGTRSRSPSSARPSAGAPRPPRCGSARSRRGPRPCASGARSEAARARAPPPAARRARRGSRCTSARRGASRGSAGRRRRSGSAAAPSRPRTPRPRGTRRS